MTHRCEPQALEGAAEWVEPEGKNGRALLVFFSFSACTDAESLEHPRARSFKIAERVSPSVHPSAGGF